jgi:hypothetical protein
MAHECPDCGLICHCNSDIDDCVLNMPNDVNACIHCSQFDAHDDYDEYEDDCYHDFEDTDI